MKKTVFPPRAGRLPLYAGLTLLCALLGLGLGTLLAHLLARRNIDLTASAPSILAIVLVAAVTAFFEIELHELGHLAIGRLLGYRLASFRILCFCWERIDGRLRFRVYPPHGYGGVCAMLPPGRSVTAKRQAWFYAGGLLTNGLTGIAMAGCLFALSPDRPVFWLLITALFVTLALMLPNLLPAGKQSIPTDGRLVFGILRGDSLTRDMLAAAETGRQLAAGIRPSALRLPPLPQQPENGFQAVSLLQSYLAALDGRDEPRMRERLIRLEAALPLFQPIQRPAALYELIYYYSVVQPDDERARRYYEQIRPVLDRDMDCNGRRVRAAYAAGVERIPALAQEFRAEGLSACPHFPLRGQAEMERALLMNCNCDRTADMV